MMNLLKEGTKQLSGVAEAVLKNIDAVKELSTITRTSLGPNGMNKMVINKIGKLFVTNDAATILKELEVVHPAAKMCVFASEQQQQELGDATNLVVILCGELLAQAESLLRMGLHPSDVIRGFEKAGERVNEILPGLLVKTIQDLRNQAEVVQVITAAISAKQSGFEDVLAPIVAQACIQVLPAEPKYFSVDSVRVAKIIGGGVGDATVMRGVVLTRDSEGTIKSVRNAKVAVYSQGFDAQKTDTKGKVLIEKATELEQYAKTEENAMEQKVKAIADAGITLVACGGTIGEMAMHFFEKFKIMVLKTSSKFELRRICQATNAQPLSRMGAPTPEEIGSIDICQVREVGGTKVTVLEQEKSGSGISTIILRGATENILDDIERAIDDAINVFKAATKDGRFLSGAGAAEIEIARLIQSFGEQTPGQDQYAIKKFGEAFEVVPRTLAENAGMNATSAIATLYARHQEGNTNFGVDIEGHDVADAATTLKVYDHLLTKLRAIELANATAITILRISQIIMAKPAGIPVPGQKGSGTMGSYDTGETM